MVKDVYEASWDIMQTLIKEGKKMNANQIFHKTITVGGKTTIYAALDILLDEELIDIDSKKHYTINRFKFEQDSQVLKVYDEYENITENFKKIFDKLSERLKKHKPVLNPHIQSDLDLVRELLVKEPYFSLINIMVKLFQLGSSMEFFINADVFPKIVKARAISLRRKNEQLFSKYFELLKKHEPVLWGETIKLIQTRLYPKINTA